MKNLIAVVLVLVATRAFSQEKWNGPETKDVPALWELQEMKGTQKLESLKSLDSLKAQIKLSESQITAFKKMKLIRIDRRNNILIPKEGFEFHYAKPESPKMIPLNKARVQRPLLISSL